MIALLKKDVFVMDKQMRVLVILALIFNLIPQHRCFWSYLCDDDRPDAADQHGVL